MCINVPRFSPQSGYELRFINEHEKSNEPVRTKTNSCGVSSFEFVGFVANFFSYHNAKHECFIRNIFAQACDFTYAQISEICGLNLPELFFLWRPRRTSPGWIPGAARCSGRNPGADMGTGGRAAL